MVQQRPAEVLLYGGDWMRLSVEMTLKLSGRKEPIRGNLEKACLKEDPPQCKDLDVKGG